MANQIFSLQLFLSTCQDFGGGATNPSKQSDMKNWKKDVQGQVFDYDTFMAYMNLLVQEKATSGEKQTDALIDFTALNYRRMLRLNKKLVINDQLVSAVEKAGPLTFLVITEAWCGDSAQVLPLFGGLSQLANVDLHILLRDQNPDLMDQYLTHGGRSIPKIIAFDFHGNERFTWGPRPEEAQAIVSKGKLKPNTRWQDVERELHSWYARNKMQEAQREVLQLIQAA